MQTKFTELTDSQWEIVKKELEIQDRKRKYSLRVIFNGLLWLTRTGAQWRNMESRYPCWQLIYYYFNKWNKAGVLTGLLDQLVIFERNRKQMESRASAVAIDSQSVKKVSFIAIQTGIDGNKKVNGRKRHLAVDKLGLPLAISVSAADVHDSVGGYELLWQLEKSSNRISLVRTDKAYRGEFSKVVETLYKWQMEITQKPESQQGFVPQKGRWQVERSFAWLNFFRRLAKDYEKTPAAAMAFIQLTFVSIILARIT
ncbi:MAG: IS5 family transposase [Sphingobacteriaceae bacterium]|nr:MAG: IS5 family transposase [Sphingobacteriaceae bacterium]